MSIWPTKYRFSQSLIRKQLALEEREGTDSVGELALSMLGFGCVWSLVPRDASA